MVNPRKKMAAVQTRKAKSTRRKLRLFSGRPRLTVSRSLNNIYCQIIDDEQGRTLAAACSLEKGLREALKGLKKTDVAAKIGEELAGRAKSAGVTKVAFDRGHYKFHGRIKALAEAARAGGLEF